MERCSALFHILYGRERFYMDRQIVIITADERQEKLASLLYGKKKRCSWDGYRKEKRDIESIFVLPIPVSKLNKDTALKEKLKEELINPEGGSCSVFGGVLDQEWKSFLEEKKITYWDFMKLPEVVEGNGWITAEATVAEVLQHGERSIQGQKVLVTGYGCCGRKIAEVFSVLGADVYVAARRKEVRLQVERDGYQAFSFPEIMEYMGDVNTVINTVPAMVITEDIIRRMSKETLIIDIASKPGGTDFEAAQRHGIKARLALGLPGIYTTTSSAELLKNAILKYAPLQRDEREEQLWIFQIII